MDIGFIGLGRMGGPMATRLLKAGHNLTVYDRSETALAALTALGARAAGSPAEVGSAADIVLTSLPTPDIVHQVVLGPRGVAEGNRAKILVDLSTSGPKMATAIAEGLAARGRIIAADAPVSGGVSGAEKGTLAVMVSCPQETFAELAPVLETFGKVFFCGEKPGLAQTLKLANNMLAAAALAVSAEVFAMGVKAGLDPQTMVDVINVSSGRNSAVQDKFPRSVMTGTFDFGFATALSYKDVRLCVDEAEAMGVPMVVGAAVRQMFAVTNASQGPDSDFTSIARVLEGWAGVEIRSRPKPT